MAGNPKTNETVPGTGKSEADAARPVPMTPRPDAGPGDGEGVEPPDAAEAAGTKRKSGVGEGSKPEGGAVAPDDLNTENDGGAV